MGNTTPQNNDETRVAESGRPELLYIELSSVINQLPSYSTKEGILANIKILCETNESYQIYHFESDISQRF